MQKQVTSLIFYKRQILLLHRDDLPTILDPDTWQAIGGVEEGESFDEAIRREIEEETHLTPANITYLGKLNYQNFELAVYTVRLDDEEVSKLSLGNEGQEVRFFEITEVADLNLSTKLRFFYTKYLTALVKLSKGEAITPEEVDLVS